MNGVSGDIFREYQRNCRQSSPSESLRSCKTSGGSKRIASNTTHGVGLREESTRTELHPRATSNVDQGISTSFDWRPLTIKKSMIQSLALLLFLFMSISAVCATAPPPNSSQLLEICRTDAICASKFYLSSTPSSYNEKAFAHLFEMFTRDANITLSDAPSTGSIEIDSWWWLQLLRRADFCGAGQFYLYGVGCRCRKPGSCDAPDPSKFVWEYWTFIAIAIGILIIIVWKAQAIVNLQMKLDREILMLRRAAGGGGAQSLPPPTQQQSLVMRTDVKL